MKCPICDQEMEKGRAVNSTIRAVDLVFVKDGNKFNLKDLIPNDNRVAARIIAGEAIEAYYCVECEKITMISDLY